MKKILFLASIFVFFGLLSSKAHAAGFNATDELGHLPIDFTTSTENNGLTSFASPTSTGFYTSVGNQSLDVALDLLGHRLFASDNRNNRVLVFNLDSNNNLIDHIADYVIGQTDFVSSGSGLTSSTFNAPAELVYDSTSTRLFVADSANSRVLIFNLSSGITNGMPASNVIGQPNFTTSTAAVTSSTLGSIVMGISYDSVSQKLFVGDHSYGRVLIFDLSSGITNGMPASYVLGHTTFTNGSGGTSSSTLGNPDQLYYDHGSSQLFVSDGGDCRATVFDLSSGITNGMPAVHVLGEPDFTTVNCGNTASDLSWPHEVIYDAASKRLYIADFDFNGVLVYDLSSGITDGMAAVGILGQPAFASKTASTTQESMIKPSSIAIDPNHNRLYVGDTSNNRVMIYDLLQISTSTLPGGTSGTSYSQTVGTFRSQGTVSMSVFSGSLPTGLSLSSGGTLSGTPSAAGTYTFSLLAKDTLAGPGQVASQPQSFTVTIASGAAAAEPSHGGQTFADLYPGVVYGTPYTGGGSPVPSAPTSSAPTGATVILTLPTTTPSKSDLQAQVQMLLKQLADLRGKISAKKIIFTRAFAIGEVDEAIRALQRFLNDNGFIVSRSGAGSPGNETDKFGILTRKALCLFQVEQNLVSDKGSPSCGTFGPKTRALVNGLTK